MANLKVSLENIIPLTEARDHFSQIVADVQKDKLYILTKGGKPAVAVIDVKYLGAITGGSVNLGHVETEIQKDPIKVGRTPMIKVAENTAQPSGFKPYTPAPLQTNSFTQNKPTTPNASTTNFQPKPIFGQNSTSNNSNEPVKVNFQPATPASPIIPPQTPVAPSPKPAETSNFSGFNAPKPTMPVTPKPFTPAATAPVAPAFTPTTPPASVPTPQASSSFTNNASSSSSVTPTPAPTSTFNAPRPFTPPIPPQAPVAPKPAAPLTMPPLGQIDTPANAPKTETTDTISVSNSNPFTSSNTNPVKSPIIMNNSQPTSTPPSETPKPVAPTTGTGLNMTSTMPKDNTGDTINVIELNDEPENPTTKPISPDDKVGPAQYSSQDDVDDMVLD